MGSFLDGSLEAPGVYEYTLQETIKSVTHSPRRFQKTSEMCIAAQNTATISLIRRDSTTYSFSSSRMCIEAQNTATIC
jgi:hypothetical protein